MTVNGNEVAAGNEEVNQEQEAAAIEEETTTVSRGGGTNGKNVWGIRMFGTPAGAGTEWARRTQAYV